MDKYNESIYRQGNGKYFFNWTDKPNEESAEKVFTELFSTEKNLHEKIDNHQEVFDFSVSDYLIGLKLAYLVNQIEDSTVDNKPYLFSTEQRDKDTQINYKVLNFNHEDKKIKEILWSYLLVPYYIASTKAALILLDRNDIKNKVSEKLIEDLKKYIREVIWYLETPYEVNMDQLSEIYFETDNEELLNLTRKINSIIYNEFEPPLFDEEEDLTIYNNIKLRKLKIRHLLEEIPTALGKDYEFRYSMLRAFKQKFQLNDLSTNSILKLTIDERKYESEIGQISQQMVYRAEEMFQCLFTIEDYQNINAEISDDQRYNDKSNMIEKYIEKMNRWAFCRKVAKLDFNKEVKNMIKFWSNTNRCFGIMNVKNVGGYFTISGTWDFKDLTVADIKGKKINQVSKGYENNIVDYLKNKYFPCHNYSYLTGDVVNYWKGGKFGNPIILRDDKNPNLGDYSCCERKMLAEPKLKSIKEDIELFSRWTPCEKCIPALNDYKGKIVCKVYAMDKKKFLEEIFSDNPKIFNKKK